MNASQYMANHQFEFVKHFRSNGTNELEMRNGCAELFAKSVDPLIMVMVDIMTDVTVDDTSDDGFLRIHKSTDRQPLLHCFVFNFDKVLLEMSNEERLNVLTAGLLNAIKGMSDLRKEAHNHPLVIVAAYPAIPPPGYLGNEHTAVPH